jgi:hypothetical protein
MDQVAFVDRSLLKLLKLLTRHTETYEDLLCTYGENGGMIKYFFLSIMGMANLEMVDLRD